MNEVQARRVLGVGEEAGDADIQRAFSAQLRQFRDARRGATDPELCKRLDRALALTVVARRRLLGPLNAPGERSLRATRDLRAQPADQGDLQDSGQSVVKTLVKSLVEGLMQSTSGARRVPVLLLLAGVVLLTAGLLWRPLQTLLPAPSPATVTPEPTMTAPASELETAPESARESVPDSVPEALPDGIASSRADRDADPAQELSQEVPQELPGVLAEASAPLAPPSTETPAEADDAAEAAAADQVAAVDVAPVVAVAVSLSRAWLDPARLALARSFATDAGPVISREVNPELLADLELPADWRWQTQRDGGVALYDADGAWALVLPLLEDGALSWLCLSRDQVDGCRAGFGSALSEQVAAGAVDAHALANALSPARQAGDGDLARRYLAQAWRNGDGRGAFRLAELGLGDAGSASGRQRALAWFERAEASFAAQGQTLLRVRALERLARIGALDEATPQESAARWLVRCRDTLRTVTSDGTSCPGPADIGVMLELRARSPDALEDDWMRARWWYEQGVAERDGYSVRALARLIALGATAPPDRRTALALLEDAAGVWDDFGEADAADSAAQLALIWRNGWGVPPNAVEASWWASQGARLGHVGAALQLAGAFVLGTGTERNIDRARNLVTIYREFSPLFEVAFYRNVGQRLTEGGDPGVTVDPDAGRAWYRRAFGLCTEMAEAGDADAQIELAGMYFSGDGVARDAARAAALYTQWLDRAPVKAGNMLAWIRATHPDPALRDGDAAVLLARRVVALAPQPDFYDTLAAALAESGDFDEAVRMQQQAMALLAEQADPGLGGEDIADDWERLGERLTSYRAGRPWRDDQQGEAG